MISLLPYYMARSLIFTIILECGLAAAIGIRTKSDLLNVLLVNVLTNPVLVITTSCINIYYGLEARHIAVAVLEISAFLAEAVIYRKYLDYKKLNPFLVSLILNAFSYSCGLVINKIL